MSVVPGLAGSKSSLYNHRRLSQFPITLSPCELIGVALKVRSGGGSRFAFNVSTVSGDMDNFRLACHPARVEGKWNQSFQLSTTGSLEGGRSPSRASHTLLRLEPNGFGDARCVFTLAHHKASELRLRHAHRIGPVFCKAVAHLRRRQRACDVPR
jgi:hypothetical protein